MKQRLIASAATTAVALLTGCAQSGLYDAQNKFKAGDTLGAQEMFVSYAQKNLDSEHTVIAQLELGTAYFTNGYYAEAGGAFEAAEAQLEKIDSLPDVSATDEGFAAITNPAEIVYDGTPYDRVLATVYRGIAFAALGDYDAARPAFINAEFRQEEAIEKRREQLERAQKESQSEKSSGAFTAASEAYQGSFFEGYGSVSNSFADAAIAAFRFGQFKDRSDASAADFLFGRVAEVNPANTYITNDRQLAASAIEAPKRTFVFYATGFAPFRDQFKVQIPYPSPANNGQIRFMAASFPILRQDESGWVPPITLRADGNAHTVQKIADMDAIIGAEFKARLPIIIARHGASAIGRTIAAETAEFAGNQAGGYISLATSIGSFIYKNAQNESDRRTWATLPKYYYYASFDNPADGIVTLDDPVYGTQSIEVDPNTANFVYVRAVRPQIPFQIMSFPIQ